MLLCYLRLLSLPAELHQQSSLCNAANPFQHPVISNLHLPGGERGSKVSGIDISHCFHLCRLLSESQNIENMSFLPISPNLDRSMRFFAAK